MPSDMLPSYRTMKYKSPMWGIFMSRKSKINPIEKVKIVERYLRGEIGMRQAGKELGIAYQSIQKWVSIYKGKGPAGLLISHKTTTIQKN